MVFAVNGMVRWKKKKLANGIDGKFETNDLRVISRLQALGFKEYHVVEAERAEYEKLMAEKKANEVVEEKAEVVEEKENVVETVAVETEAEVAPKPKPNPYRRKQK